MRLPIALAWISAITFCACSTAKNPLPPPVTNGAAMALPPIGRVVPVFVYMNGTSEFAVERKEILGLALSGKLFRALSVEDAVAQAGGTRKLLDKLSDEGEIAHVAKASGATLGILTGFGLVPCTHMPTNADSTLTLAVCATGGALGAAAGIVASVGTATYLGINTDAREFGILEDISLPSEVRGAPLRGYVFLPVETYQKLQVPVTYPYTQYSPQNIKVMVESYAEPSTSRVHFP